MKSTVQLTMQIPQLQSTDKVVFVLRVRVVQVPQMLVVEVVEIPQLQLIEKIVAWVVSSRRKTVEAPQLQFVDEVVDFPIVAVDVLVVHVVQVPQVQVVRI